MKEPIDIPLTVFVFALVVVAYYVLRLIEPKRGQDNEGS